MAPSTYTKSLLRSKNHQLKPVLNSVPLISVATAQINQTTFTYPLAQITVDNASADWLTEVRAGRLFSIGTVPGGRDVAYGCVREDATLSTLLLTDAKNLGDAGYSFNIISPIQDDYYITVYKYRPAYSFRSSIRQGKIYKRWNRVFSTPNPDPIVNMGEWQAQFIDPNTGLATFTFEVSPHVWNSTASVYSWNIDGNTLIGGSLSGTSVTFQAPPGFYEIECTVTQANGRSRKGYRYAWANTKSGTWAPLSYRHRVKISKDVQTRAGRSLTIDISTSSISELFPSQAYLLKEYPTYTTDEAVINESGIIIDTFVGYSLNKDIEITRSRGRYSIDLESPVTIAKFVGTDSQKITEKPAPANWTEVTNVLSNPIGAAWYLIAHHAPYLIDGHDFSFSSSIASLRRRTFSFPTVNTNLGSQLEELGKYFLGNIGSRSNGTTRIVRNPLYFTSDDRNLLETFWTYVIGDFKAPIKRLSQGVPEVSQVYAYGLAFDGGVEGTPYAALAPGRSASQGKSKEDLEAFIVKLGVGQLEVQRVAGHHYALRNPEWSNVLIEVVGNKDFVEPCDLDRWYVFELPEEFDPEGQGLDNRMIPVKVTRSWSDSGSQVKRVSQEFQIETFGQPGIAIPVDRGAANETPTSSWNPGVTDVYSVKARDFEEPIPYFFAASNGYMGRTFTFDRQTVDWYRIEGMSGYVMDGTIDPFSPYFTDPEDSLNGWIVTVNDNTLRIYFLEGLNYLAPPDLTLQSTQTVIGDFFGKVRIKASDTEQDYVICSWRTRQRSYLSRTTNGTSWGSAISIGSPTVPVDTENDDTDIGVDIRGETVIVIATSGSFRDDGKAEFMPYISTDKAGGFSLLGDIPTDYSSIPGSVSLASASRGYLPMVLAVPPTPPTPISLVTFGLGGYADYSVNGAGVTAGLGNPPPAAWTSLSGSPDNSSLALSVEVDLNAEYSLSNFEWEIGFVLEVGIIEDVYIVPFIWLYDENDDIILKKDLDPDYRAPNQTSYFRQVSITAEELKLGGRVFKVLVGGRLFWGFFDGVFPNIHYGWIDNINIEGTMIEKSTQRTLFLLTSLTGTPNWSDLTNTPDDALPFTTYGMSTPDNTRIQLVGSDEDMVELREMTSGSGGSSFSKRGKPSKFRGIKTSASGVCIGFGVYAMSLSVNSGQTYYSRIGNWSSKVGPIGKFDFVMGVF